jgi:hypothetical protein
VLHVSLCLSLRVHVRHLQKKDSVGALCLHTHTRTHTHKDRQR